MIAARGRAHLMDSVLTESNMVAIYSTPSLSSRASERLCPTPIYRYTEASAGSLTDLTAMGEGAGSTGGDIITVVVYGLHQCSALNGLRLTHAYLRASIV
jgi:hypothetical protein